MTRKTSKRVRLDTDTPAYKAIANELRTAIRNRQYPDGQRLPTEDELVDRYQLSRQTIRRAFQELANDGLIYRVRKRGTFAVPNADAPFLRSFGSAEDMLNLPKAAEVEILLPLQVRKGSAELDAIFGASGKYASLSLRQFDKGKPILVSEIFLPEAIVAVLQSEPALRTGGHRGNFSIVGLIAKLWPDRVQSVTQTIYPKVVDKKLAALLECPAGEAVLMAERQYHDSHNIPVEFARTYFHPQRYVLKTLMRR